MADPTEPDDDPGGAGRRLREALEPPTGAVERVVRGSLAHEARRRDNSLAGQARRPDSALALRDRLLAGESDCLDQPPIAPTSPRQRLAAALAMALLLAAGLWLVSGRPDRSPRPRQEPAAVSITNVGGIVVARSAGRVHIVRSSPAGPPPAGISFIRYGGEEE